MKLFRKKEKINQQPTYTKKIFEIYNKKGKNSNFENICKIFKGLNGEQLALILEPYEQKLNCYESAEIIADIFGSFLPQISNFDSPLTFLQRTLFVGASVLMNKTLIDKNFDSRCKITGFLTVKNKLYTITVGNGYLMEFETELKILPAGINSKICLERYVEDKEILKNNEKLKTLTNEWFLSSSIIQMPLDTAKMENFDNKTIILACNNVAFETLKEKEAEKILLKSKAEPDISQVLGIKIQEKTDENVTICIYR